MTKQAVSRARRGIMPSLFKELFDVSVDIFSRSDVPRKLWRGKKSVYAFDGSKIQIPNSPSNFEKFGEMFASDNPEKRWAMALISVIYDVMNDFIYHGPILPYLFPNVLLPLSIVKLWSPSAFSKTPSFSLTAVITRQICSGIYRKTDIPALCGSRMQ